MKKNYKAKSMMRLLIIGLLMVNLLLGCSSTEAETETAEAKPEVEATAQEPAEVEEEASAEETKSEETETKEAEAETGTETTEEESAEVVAEDPGEVTYITDYTSIDDYVGSLDSEKPAIVIYNEEEGYIINMQEGQHYQLKTADKILFNFIDPSTYGWSIEIIGAIIIDDTKNYCEAKKINYENMQPKQEFFLDKQLDSGEIITLTCYFDPPAE